ncbi:MAG: twin-arginine translocation signal domain-containing protein, partial [Pseudomonadota bacterium]
MITRRTFLAAAAATPLAAALATPALAATPPVYATDGVAINGYDPVAYFT